LLTSVIVRLTSVAARLASQEDRQPLGIGGLRRPMDQPVVGVDQDPIATHPNHPSRRVREQPRGEIRVVA
jgi:hypothetical protein